MKWKIVINNFFLGFIILALCAPVFSKESQVASKWVTTPMTIDGSNNEWGEDTLTFEKKVNVDYAFRNDSENLYVLFIFKEPRFMSSINKTGMTLWFNTEGKKKKKHGVRFQIKILKADAFIFGDVPRGDRLYFLCFGDVPKGDRLSFSCRGKHLQIRDWKRF